MRIARWSARLLCFNYGIVYHAGTQNQTAAACLDYYCLLILRTNQRLSLSWLHCFPQQKLPLHRLSSNLPLHRAQSSLLCAHRFQKDGLLFKNLLSTELQPYFKMRNGLSVHGDLVFRGSRLVVPISLRKTFVVLAHENPQGIV